MKTSTISSTCGLGKFITGLVAVVLLLTLAGPYFVLAIARQETPMENYNYSESFFKQL